MQIMKSTYLIILSICAISLTSCAPTEKTNPASTTQAKSGIQWSQWLGQVVELSDLIPSFESPTQALQEALKNQYVIVYFYGDSCPPCRRMAPSFSSVATQFDNVLFLKINAGKFETLFRAYGGRQIPYLLFFKDGVQVNRYTGLLSEKALQSVVHETFNV
jgi:thiol-disulfide isomerase/thioredoxin